MRPVWIAGRDKPHRCPSCWRCPNDGPIRSRLWRVAKWLPRRCRFCHALTLTTWPRAWYGTRIPATEETP